VRWRTRPDVLCRDLCAPTRRIICSRVAQTTVLLCAPNRRSSDMPNNGTFAPSRNHGCLEGWDPHSFHRRRDRNEPQPRETLRPCLSRRARSVCVWLCLVRTLKHFDTLYVAGIVLAGAFLMFVLFWMRRAVRQLAPRGTANKPASQFLWSCVLFSAISFGFGLPVSGFLWFGSDFVQRFGVFFWGAMTAVAIYPVLRDAKRLAEAAAPSQVTSGQGDQGSK
jgi:hypothetical protein